MPAAGARWRIAALVGGLFALALFHSLAAGIDEYDELWFLRVCQRVAEGDRLYGDVFYGTLPLGVWLGAGGVALAGAEVVVVKALVAASVTGSGLAAGSVMRSLGARPRSALVVATLVVVVPGALSLPVYQPLATAFALAALAAILCWDGPDGPLRPLVAAGVFVGLSVAAKHWTGGLAALALVVAIVARVGLRAPLRAARAVVTAAAAAVLVEVVVLIPVILSGSWPKFVEYAFTAKGTYLDVARISYTERLGRIGDDLTRVWESPSIANADAVELKLAYVVLPLAVAVVAIRALRDQSPRLVAVVAFTLAAAATLYPLASEGHMTAVMPAVVLAAAVAVREQVRDPRRRRALVGIATAAAAAIAGLSALIPATRLVRGSAVVTDVPHLRGVLLPPYRRDGLAAERRALRELGRRHPAILPLGGRSAKVQLLGELRNPTPFDYPWVTAMGERGEELTAAAVREGRFPVVCMTDRLGVRLAPLRLEAAVRRTLTVRGHVGTCTLYTR